MSANPLWVHECSWARQFWVFWGVRVEVVALNMLNLSSVRFLGDLFRFGVVICSGFFFTMFLGARSQYFVNQLRHESHFLVEFVAARSHYLVYSL